MAACVAASIAAATIKGIDGNVDDAKLQNALGEDIFQAYLMAAVGIAAGQDDRPLAPADSVLYHRGVKLTSVASSLSERVTDVPREKEVDVSAVEAMPKIIHHQDGFVLTSSSVHYTRGVTEVSEYAESDIVSENVNEANSVNREPSTEHCTSSDENCVNHLIVISAIPNSGAAKDSNDADEAEPSRVVVDKPAKKRDTEACLSPALIASQGDDAKDSSNLRAPSNELDVIQNLGRRNDDDHDELSETGKGPAVNLKMEAIGTLDDSDVTELNEILVDEREIRSRASTVSASKTESKADVSSTRSTTIDEVGSAENATIMSRSFSFTGLNHVAFCVENLERSLDFYCRLLGMQTNLDRPELPYRGAWLFVGAEGIHIMEVPNPDPVKGRPAHGGFDRHACLNCKNVEAVRLTLEEAGIPYQPSPVPSLFTRDPDGNGLEFIEVNS